MHVRDEISDLRSTLQDLKTDGYIQDTAIQDIEEHLVKICKEAEDLDTYREALEGIADEFDCCETALARISSALMRARVISHNRAASLTLIDLADMIETGVLFIPRGHE